jgi:hypothetical protein
VAQQVPVTTMQPVQMTQECAVNVTRYVDEVVTQQVPQQVCRIETTEEVRDIPFTVQKPVTERVVVQTPVQTVRYEDEEHVRQVPYTVQRIEYEEQITETPVKVCRYVSETSAVQVPKTVGRWEAVQTTRLVPRTVTMRVPLNGWYDSVVYEGPVTTYEAPVTLPPLSSTTTRRIIAAPAPATTEVPTPAPSVLRTPVVPLTPVQPAPPKPAPEKDESKTEESKSDEPKDSDPTGKPELNGDLDLNSAEGAVKPASTDKHA